MNAIIKQAVDNCYMVHHYEHPGTRCSGLGAACFYWVCHKEPGKLVPCI